MPSAAAADVSGVSIFSAVQSRLGLKLEAQKGPMDLIVVDHIEKTPAENWTQADMLSAWIARIRGETCLPGKES